MYEINRRTHRFDRDYNLTDLTITLFINSVHYSNRDLLE